MWRSVLGLGMGFGWLTAAVIAGTASSAAVRPDAVQFAAAHAGAAEDRDQDGLPDAVEDANRNGRVDSAETDPSRADTDGDGLLDGEEVAHHTDPLNAASWFPKRLAAWWWDGPSETWRNEATGQPPMGPPGTETQVPGWVDQGIRFAPAPAGPLRYPVSDVQGRLNLQLDQGSVRLWFKPDAAIPLPAAWRAPLVEVGRTDRPAAGWWSWYLLQDGQGQFWSKFSYGLGDNLPPSRFDSRFERTAWAGTPSWHELVLSYGPAATRVYHNNTLNVWTDSAKNVWDHGPGVARNLLPTEAGRAPGFQFGIDASGASALPGTLDSIETFNYPLGFTETFRQQQVTLQIVTNGSRPALQFTRNFEGSRPKSGIVFPMSPDPWPLQIHRRLLGDSNWGAPVVDRGTNETWIDSTVEPGRSYEYRVRTVQGQAGEWIRHWVAGIERPAIHQRGTVLLVVDRTLASGLKTELAQLRTHLAGDGWMVKEWLQAPRHDDRSFAPNRENRSKVAEWIAGAHTPGATNVVFLLGHVTIPYSGTGAMDGHADHRGGWVCDAYYGYGPRKSSLWTDTNTVSASTVAVPDDGKFDQNHLPATPDFGVGRVDFAGLPALGRVSEVEWIRRYLAKSFRYRMHQIPTFGRVSCQGANPRGIQAVLSAQTLGGGCFGVTPGTVFDGYNLRDAVPCDLGVHFQYSSVNDAGVFDGLGGNHTTAEFADPEKEVPVVFRQVWFSYAPDWARLDASGRLPARNNWLLASLAGPRYGLATFSGPVWDFTLLGAGAPLAELMVRGRSMPGVPAPAFQSILGDPTLRLFRVSPPGALTVRRSGSSATLSWTASPDPGCLYYVYRSREGLSGYGEPLNPDGPVEETTFVDRESGRGVQYQVRATRLQVTGSGSFWNTSQGVFGSER